MSMCMCMCMHVLVCMLVHAYVIESVCFQYPQHKMMVTMSEQALVDCSWGYGNFGCDGGETVNAYQWIMDNGCIPNEYSYGMYLQQVRLSLKRLLYRLMMRCVILMSQLHDHIIDLLYQDTR